MNLGFRHVPTRPTRHSFYFISIRLRVVAILKFQSTDACFVLIQVCYDQTVRDQHNNVIQFTYGDDGYDATRIVRLKAHAFERFDHTRMAIERSDYVALAEQDRVLAEFATTCTDELISTPVDFEFLLEKTIRLSRNEQASISRGVAETWNELLLPCLNQLGSKPSNPKLRWLACTYLNTQTVKRISTKWLRWLCAEVIETRERQIVCPGEMVGVLASQCISEPATQMT